ncbi:hypothetical protein CW357_13130 [Rummeliibacillus sp. TYF005]|uniref:hypothetical protein n=1 Tax=Rummeliibacillus sp. TYF005 TaxID=2058214 RepID=UPI000F54A49F|nr:hypothetical protein [Rummeliibacillus sp. TYF005]RPJ94924.1 hypothetical protein CW357_13130 [Rummeliibacillus sp. TYF005]
MPFYPPPNPRRRPQPPYRQGFRTPDQFRGQRQPFFIPNQQQLPQFRSRELPNHLNTIMGHVGTITNGVNMMRQLGSIMSLFR